MELLQAKKAGREIEPREEPAPQRVINLMDALRASIGAETERSRPPPAPANAALPKGRREARQSPDMRALRV